MCAPGLARVAEGEKALLRKVDLLTQAVPGSHWAGPETHGGGRGGRRSAPMADGRLRRGSRIRKGVKANDSGTLLSSC